MPHRAISVLHPATPPAASELPLAQPPPALAEVTPPVELQARGLDNIPEEALPAAARREDELDHAGLDVELPDEDQAHGQPPSPIERFIK